MDLETLYIYDIIYVIVNYTYNTNKNIFRRKEAKQHLSMTNIKVWFTIQCINIIQKYKG